jgi:hypothetical protein
VVDKEDEMSVVLDREFATAEDTAAALGVPKSRLKRLLRLAGPVMIEAKRGDLRTHRGAASSKRRNGAVVTAKRKKQTRGKAKKAAR